MKLRNYRSGMTIAETTISTALIAALGLIIFSMLQMGTVMSGKNAAVNTAHQQARIAMLQMLYDLHSTVSLPYLLDANGAKVNGTGPAAGIGFQLWANGPHQIVEDADANDDEIHIKVPSGYAKPVKDQRLIIPTHQIEVGITKVTNEGGGIYELELDNDLGVAITGTESPTNYNIVCYTTEVCSYTVVSGGLQWKGPGTKKSFAVLGNDITNPTPFSTPLSPGNTPYSRFVSAIDLSTSDSRYSNRGFKAANILLNGQVPIRARLTTFQDQ